MFIFQSFISAVFIHSRLNFIKPSETTGNYQFVAGNKKLIMSIKKQYLKKEPVCKVTFRIANNNEKNVEKVKIIGDFNNWDQECEPMKKLKNGEFSQTLKLEKGKEYQFRYLINGSIWENEPAADKFVSNGVVAGESNSVLVL